MSVARRVFFVRKYWDLKISFCGLRSFSTNITNYSSGTILTSGVNDVDIPQISIPELVYSKIGPYYKYVAIECPETGRRYTFEQIRVKSRSLSKALRKIIKLENKDTIAVLLPNIPEFPICVLGSLEAGLIITTINPMYTAEEISKQLLDSSAKAIITLGELYKTAKSATDLAKKKLPIITIKRKSDEEVPEGAIRFEELIDTKIDIPDFDLGSKDDIAILPYSSGTTGLPKGVELTHFNIVANITQANHPNYSYVQQATESFQEVVPAVLPMFHIYGFTVTLINLMCYGSKLITLRRFTPDLYISVLKNYDISLIFAAPPLILFLALHPEVTPEDLKTVRAVLSGAAPLGALDEERFLEKSNKVPILQGYGLTETSPGVALTSPKLLEKYPASGSIGKVLPNTLAKVVAVDDPTGTPLGPNQSGELLVKGPQVMKGYHNKPEETKNAFLDGWFRTGDLVHYNDNGLLYVTDRLKELIKVKGYQVAPAELEEVIRDFPSVADAAVIGIPHPIYGEVPRAYVVPKKNTELKTEELQEYVTSKVASYKQLKGGVEIIDAIPKNAAGKILRRQLKIKYEEADN